MLGATRNKIHIETTMKIDIDNLSYDELIDLNHRVVERLKFLDQMQAHSQMLEFSIGEKVEFAPHGRAAVMLHTGFAEKSDLIYQFRRIFEEGFEMFGIAIFNCALFREIVSRNLHVGIKFSTEGVNQEAV